MKRFVLLCLLPFLASCGSRYSQTPPDVLVRTEVVRDTAPEILLRQYPEPSEPDEMTVGGLVEYILEQRALLQKHNIDKEKLKLQQNGPVAANGEKGTTGP